MGNYIRYRPSAKTTGRVILLDGTLQEFEEPVTAAELMLEHPQQVVVELHSAAIEKRRPTPLPADKKLDKNKVYLMLPIKQGKPAALTAEEARRILFDVKAALKTSAMGLSSSKLLLALFAGNICASGGAAGKNMGGKGRVRVESDEERPPAVEVVRCLPEFMPENIEGIPEYLSRQISGKGWKPSLDTITEKKAGTKMSHWLL
ncbi:uncharacterized protein LOC110819534 [Carica papaya]|uniref:uncharacterized protein LOC110819534 n=1 Tax=Carica papaya TaxID=3649 RepID=UPI000B8CDDC1|nr:uncharacterized protein LOC110819534 [Carica papaya]